MRIEELQIVAIAIVTLVITAGLGQIVLQKMKASGTYSNETNTSLDKGVTALGEFPSWAGLIAIVVVAAFIIGVVGLLRGQQGPG